MEIKVRELCKDIADDYIRFFDDRAFSDGSAEKGCYCVWHHWTSEHERARGLMPAAERPNRKRDFARELILGGTLHGFCAFCDGQMVGFCNADLKDNYFRLSRADNPESWRGIGGERVLAIVCYIVAPDMRHKGIAKTLLDYAVRHAQNHGYDFVEGYPSQEFSPRDCGGSAGMYTERGFEIIGVEGGIIARKKVGKS